MSAILLEGKPLAARIRDDLKDEIAEIQTQTGRDICIVNVLVGDDPGAVSYADAQKRAAQDVGIHYELKKFSCDVTVEEVCQVVRELSDDESVSGVMIQKPFPEHIDFYEVFCELDPAKDIEGMHSGHIGGLMNGCASFVPCTAAAVMEHLRAANVVLRGKDVVLVGASEIVGKPLAMLLLQEMATVTVCHIATSEAGRLGDHVRQADVVIVAVGKPGLITGDMVKPGSVVIDVGTSVVDGKLVGDVDFDSVFPKASLLTPVPGGVGPVTVMMLMQNAVQAFIHQNF